ncbi:hypothetical protein TAMA11512_21450 [Selenomonas sp. TAMA-11512]|uniref:hypothetical protein n=1 Tax=Selenomonas sp. TAMA-11512 TaxID=3095337 RepID=UPI003084E0BD|nr:hypothetical protein TAMA11512_21450 [Selenomonas sp. TAMA-11512]
MCAAAAAAIGSAILGVHASRRQASAAEDAARAQREAAQQQLEAAKEAAAKPASASETARDVSAAIQQNRRRIAGAQGLASTQTGAAAGYRSGLGVSSASGNQLKSSLGA